MSLARDRLDEWYDDEIASLEKDRDNGFITEAEFARYLKSLNEQYEDELRELNE